MNLKKGYFPTKILLPLDAENKRKQAEMKKGLLFHKTIREFHQKDISSSVLKYIVEKAAAQRRGKIAISIGKCAL